MQNVWKHYKQHKYKFDFAGVLAGAPQSSRGSGDDSCGSSSGQAPESSTKKKNDLMT